MFALKRLGARPCGSTRLCQQVRFFLATNVRQNQKVVPRIDSATVPPAPSVNAGVEAEAVEASKVDAAATQGNNKGFPIIMDHRPPYIIRMAQRLTARVPVLNKYWDQLALDTTTRTFSSPAAKLSLGIWEHCEKSFFYRQCGPLSPNFRTTFELVTVHMWMLRARFDNGFSHEKPISKEFWNKIESEMWTTAVKRMKAAGVDKAGINSQLELLSQSYAERRAALTPLYPEFVKGNNNVFYNYCWRTLYCNNKKMNIWHVTQLSHYIADQLIGLSHLRLRTIVKGDIPWSLPIQAPLSEEMLRDL